MSELSEAEPGKGAREELRNEGAVQWTVQVRRFLSCVRSALTF